MKSSATVHDFQDFEYLFAILFEYNISILFDDYLLIVKELSEASSKCPPLCPCLIGRSENALLP